MINDVTSCLGTCANIVDVGLLEFAISIISSYLDSNVKLNLIYGNWHTFCNMQSTLKGEKALNPMSNMRKT